mmetsp:Transcript_15590/g.50208  ORF Transcript_15590/g.50208 Transcript_15590/m.50208 type:complete len:371 (+) Transcript_15590:992-2104(+)
MPRLADWSPRAPRCRRELCTSGRPAEPVGEYGTLPEESGCRSGSSDRSGSSVQASLSDGGEADPAGAPSTSRRTGPFSSRGGGLGGGLSSAGPAWSPSESSSPESYDAQPAVLRSGCPRPSSRSTTIERTRESITARQKAYMATIPSSWMAACTLLSTSCSAAVSDWLIALRRRLQPLEQAISVARSEGDFCSSSPSTSSESPKLCQEWYAPGSRCSKKPDLAPGSTPGQHCSKQTEPSGCAWPLAPGGAPGHACSSSQSQEHESASPPPNIRSTMAFLCASSFASWSRRHSPNWPRGGTAASTAESILGPGAEVPTQSWHAETQAALRSGAAFCQILSAVESMVSLKTPTRVAQTSTSVKDHLPKTASQ